MSDLQKDENTALRDQIRLLEKKVADLEWWVHDLQSGMYVNCVYCGHRYGPKENTPVAMADILRQHIEVCPQHPLAKARELGNAMSEAIDGFNGTRRDADFMKWLQALDKALNAADNWNKEFKMQD